jgi:ppGpp synthetase/RelA/SpoT-type nucleotidyltranferase
MLENYLVHKAEQITAVLENGKEVLQPLLASKLVKSWKRVIDKRLRGYAVWSGRRYRHLRDICGISVICSSV